MTVLEELKREREQSLICTRCAEPLVEPPDDGHCTWCREELALGIGGQS